MSAEGGEHAGSQEVADISALVAAYDPRVRSAPDRMRAATAILVGDDGTGPHLLFIERTRRSDDPWSGDMAFPGGRVEAVDADLAATARRETEEEVGIELAEPCGRLDDIGSRLERIVVTPFVFALSELPVPRPAPREVARAVWIPVEHLRSDDADARYWLFGFLPLPALAHGDDLIWGLTYRTLRHLLEVIDEP